jgi:hypothetical protein
MPRLDLGTQENISAEQVEVYGVSLYNADIPRNGASPP